MPEMSPVARAWAGRVLLHGVGDHPEPATLAEAAMRADARLRGRLAGLIGQTGYAILVARAVHLARADVPALARVPVDVGTDGGLRGISEFAQAGGDPDAAMAGLTAILGHAVGLLIAFIGEDLALHLVREAWPELARGPIESEEPI